MAIVFRRSAGRHGISQERARFVVEQCPFPLYAVDGDPDDVDLLVFLGPDANGVPLEVGIELDTGDLIVIHAMALRPRYADAYAEVMRCR